MNIFCEQYTDEYGDLLYRLTKAGELGATLLIALIIFAALIIIRKNDRSSSLRNLGYIMADIMVTVSLAGCRVFEFQTGGAITLFSMLALCLPACWYGACAGTAIGVAYGLFQLIAFPYIISFPQALMDYVFAFGIFGLAGLFREKKYGLVWGYMAAVTGRFVFSFLSGSIFFGSYAWPGWSPALYSMCYNSIYIFSEAALTLILLFTPPVRRSLEKLSGMANGIRQTEKRRQN